MAVTQSLLDFILNLLRDPQAPLAVLRVGVVLVAAVFELGEPFEALALALAHEGLNR